MWRLSEVVKLSPLQAAGQEFESHQGRFRILKSALWRLFLSIGWICNQGCTSCITGRLCGICGDPSHEGMQTGNERCKYSISLNGCINPYRNQEIEARLGRPE